MPQTLRRRFVAVLFLALSAGMTLTSGSSITAASAATASTDHAHWSETG